jgi:S-adenosylmethionine uptake transporter
VAALARVGEPESRTVFYFSIAAVVADALGMVFAGVSAWHWPSALWLMPIGLLAVFGQLCMTRAYSRGTTMVVANLQYSGIVFAGFYSLSLFGGELSWIGWLGMALIIFSGITVTVLRARAIPNAPAEDH